MRKHNYFVFILFASFILVNGCGPKSNDNKPSPAKNDTVVKNDGFIEAYQVFSDAIKHKSFKELKTLIDTTGGIFIIESPGALPYLYHLSDIEAFVSQDGKTLFDIFIDNKISEPPVSEDMPAVDCKYLNGTPYTKTGCFMKDISSSADGELNFLSVAGGNNSDKIKAEAARKKLSMKVINTFNHVYYFTKNGDNWYLTFIDLRTPCEA